MGSGPGTSRGHVLIVEDDLDTREALGAALEAEGYDVALAAHGREGLESLATRPRPCLILLDLMMPVMDGVEFLGALESDPSLASIPVVVVSAYTTRAASLKVAGFLPKPIKLDRLLEWTERYCGADRP
ncbi:MAG: response regulator [Deltaproteobacteria bacterium]|nr:response regulator [Deltaproteobacteria bacterium]